MSPKAPSVSLPSGAKMPVFGLGTWMSPPGQVGTAVEDAIDAGYRLIDGAWIYGNEKEVGQAVAKKIAEGVVKREDLFITTKLWNTMHSAAGVRKGIKLSLENLGLDYLDLYLIHWPCSYAEDGDEKFPKTDNSGPLSGTGQIIYVNNDYVDTWREMEKLVKEGLVRDIGVSNFNSYQLQRILDIGTIKPAINQVEAHVYLNQKKLAQFCSKNSIGLQGYCPLGSPARPWLKQFSHQKVLLEDPVITKLAEKYSKTPAHIALRFLRQLGYLVIPKSVTKSRIESNIEIFDFQLTEQEMQELESLDCGERYCPNHFDAGDANGNGIAPYYPFGPHAEGGVEF